MRRAYLALLLPVLWGCRDGSPTALAATRNAADTATGEYEAVRLPTLPVAPSSAGEATAVNASEQVVGWSGVPGQIVHAFLWQDSVLVDLGTLGGSGSWAQSINDGGQVAGWSFTASGATHGFVWRDSVLSDLGTLGGDFSKPTGENRAGQVVGSSTTASGATHAFLWQDSTMQDLGTLGGNYSSAAAINDAGQVVGESSTLTGEIHAFLWTGGVMTDLGTLGGTSSSAAAINSGGAVTGVSTDSAGVSHAFRWDAGVITDLGEPPAFSGGRGAVIGPDGSVVGQADSSFLVTHAILWPGDGSGMQDLGFLYPPRPRTIVHAINHSGQVVGTSIVNGSSSSTHAFVWTDGVMEDLGSLPGIQTFEPSAANAIDAGGDVVGWNGGQGLGSHLPVLWHRLDSTKIASAPVR